MASRRSSCKPSLCRIGGSGERRKVNNERLMPGIAGKAQQVIPVDRRCRVIGEGVKIDDPMVQQGGVKHEPDTVSGVVE